MKVTKLLILILAISLNTICAQQIEMNISVKSVDKSSFVSPQIQVIPIKETMNKRNYELYIELPEDYSKDTNRIYPVIYYTDAMWHIEMLSVCQEYILEDVILVGISWQLDISEDLKKDVGAHVSRFRDYSMSTHNNPAIQSKYQFGQAQTHLDFIRNDVMAYVDNTYRTDTNSRTYFGYSLSGEFGAYILMSHPDSFNNYIIGSPTIKDEIDQLSKLNTKFGPFNASDKSTSLNANVFIAHGSLEEGDSVEKFCELLKDRRDDDLFVTKEVIDGNHSTAFPPTVIHSITWLSSLVSHDINITN